MLYLMLEGIIVVIVVIDISCSLSTSNIFSVSSSGIICGIYNLEVCSISTMLSIQEWVEQNTLSMGLHTRKVHASTN